MYKTSEEAIDALFDGEDFDSEEFNLFRDDEDVVNVAIQENPRNIGYSSDRLKNNKELALCAIEQDADAYRDISEELKRDREVILVAVNINPNLMDILADEFKDDKEVVIEAVKQDGEALYLASGRLQDDKEVLNTARDFLMSDRYIGQIGEDFFFKAKENLLKYDREKELLSKLADLDKLQAQQNSNQAKVEVRIKRKL